MENKQESEKEYNKFMDLYIDLYYSPLVEEYEETKYFIKDSDKKMV